VFFSSLSVTDAAPWLHDILPWDDLIASVDNTKSVPHTQQVADEHRLPKSPGNAKTEPIQLVTCRSQHDEKLWLDTID